MVVTVQPFVSSSVQFQSIVGWIQVHVLVLECAPEALNVDVIDRSSFAIHTDANMLTFQILDVFGASELAPLTLFWMPIPLLILMIKLAT